MQLRKNHLLLHQKKGQMRQCKNVFRKQFVKCCQAKQLIKKAKKSQTTLKNERSKNFSERTALVQKLIFMN